MEESKKLQKLIKRTLDIVGSIVGLLLASPFIFCVAMRIKREMGSPVFYDSLRAGQNGKAFKLYKFRTMNDKRDENGELLPDAERITELGNKIRSSSLDELPQLLNVLKGDISLVGPRPLLLDYVPLYDSEQKTRLDVPQGITGWAQINGRNNTTWEQRFACDTWYVKNWSLMLDIKILFLTIYKVLRREGISAQGEATMPRFEGNLTYNKEQERSSSDEN